MIFSVGIICNGDRTEIVMPIAMTAAVDPILQAADAIQQFAAAGLRTKLLAILSSEAYISFEQCVGMIHGAVIPSRVDFVAGDQPGTRAGGVLPSRVSALGIYYGDPANPSPNHRVRVAKQNFPGISEEDVTHDNIIDALNANIESFLVAACDGTWTGMGGTYYRVTAASAVAATTLCNVRLVEARGYISTIRRRTLPH
jgi:hypothetical protein